MTLTWGRGDQLGLEGLLGVVLGLVLLFGLGGPAWELVTGGPVRATVDLEQTRVQGVPHLVGPVQAEVEITHPALSEQLLAVLPAALGALLVAWVLVLLLQVTRSARRDEVFAPANVRRLNAVALLIALGGTALQLVEGVCSTELASRTGVADGGLSVTVTALPLVVGLLVAFLSEVMRRGTVLRGEVEGLV